MAFINGRPLALNPYNPFTGSSVQTIDTDQSKSGIFGRPQQTTGSIFGQQQQTTSVGIFGQSQLNPPSFGQQSPFGCGSQPSNSVLAQQYAGTSNAFGQPQTTHSPFNQPTVVNTTIFGQQQAQTAMARPLVGTVKFGADDPPYEPWMIQAYNGMKFEDGKVPEVAPKI